MFLINKLDDFRTIELRFMDANAICQKDVRVQTANNITGT